MAEKASGLNDFQILQSKEMTREMVESIIAGLKDQIVCTDHCQKRHFKLEKKILIISILLGLCLSSVAGIKIVPLLLRGVI